MNDVLQEASRQTQCDILYNLSIIRGIVVKDLNVVNKDLLEFLDELLPRYGLAYSFDKNVVVIKKKEAEKEEKKSFTVTGNVTDQGLHPLPGVTVRWKGSTVGTATNVAGNFDLLLPERKEVVLVFSFVGMREVEVKLVDDKPVHVVMEEESSELEEVNVISTGYYNVDKRHLTSSVTSIKAEDIMMPGVGTIDQMLEGRVPGMIFMQNSGQVGTSPRIKIRGTTTLLGATAPLWVLDGVILSDPVNVDPQQINDLDFVNLLGNAISGLNPEDIDRIDVLKDASATAIYGPKASNGVIVITTKKGKVGTPAVSYSLTGTFRQRPRYTDRSVNVMNSEERIDYSKELATKGITVTDNNSHVGYEAAYYDYMNGKMNYEDFVREVNRMETVNTDWLGLLMHDTFSHTHSLSVSGGSDNVRYYTSLGYMDEEGNLKGERNERYSGMAKVDVNYKNFTLSFKIDGNMQDRKYTPKDVGLASYAYNTARSVNAYNEDGSLMYYQRVKNNETYDVPFSIINEREHTSDKITTEQSGLSVNLGYRFVPCLTGNVTFAYNVSHTEEQVYYGEETWYAADLRAKSRESGEVIASYTLLPKGGELRLNNTKSKSYNVRASLMFNKYLDKDQVHNLSASVIGELSSSRYTGFKITKRGYLPDRGMVFDIIDEKDEKGSPYKAYFNWLRTDEEARGKMSNSLTNQVGLIGTISYMYKDLYILNANCRIDGSNKFGDASNDRLNPIWSVSGRGNLQDVVNKWWVNTLALKMSYGYQGNMSAQDSPELIIQKQGTNKFFNEYYSTVKYYPNPDLKWEKTSTYNVDVEFALFNNKLSGNLSFYYRHTTDAFMSKTVSRISGVNHYTVNKGVLDNSGFECTLNFVPVNTLAGGVNPSGKRKGFIWRLDPNFGSVFNQLVDKLKSKDQVLQDEITYRDFLNGKVQMAGRPVNTFYSYKFEELSPEDGRPLFYGTNENEKLSVHGEEMTYLDYYKTLDMNDLCMAVMEHSGCREPFMQGSISNYLGWNNWGLSFNLAYSIGGKTRLMQMYGDGMTNAPGAERNMRREFVKRWKRPGDEQHTSVPGILSSEEYKKTAKPWWQSKSYEFAGTIWEMYDNSSVRVVSSDYLKLSSISLRYVFPMPLCQKLRMKSAYLSLNGTNIFTICSSKLKGQDPQQSGTSDLINISVRPTYSLQLNVTF